MYKLISLLFLSLSFIVVLPQHVFAQTATPLPTGFGDVDINVVAPPQIDDLELTISADVVEDSNNDLNQVITYTVGYRSLANGSWPLELVVEWEEGESVPNPGNFYDVFDYVPSSATNAHDGTPPVIDTINRTITWSIPALVSSATPHTIQFQLQTKPTLITYDLIEVYVNTSAVFGTTAIPEEDFRIFAQEQDSEFSFTFAPQGRVGPSQTNDDADVTIEVRPVGGAPNSFLYSEEVTTNTAGQVSNMLLVGVIPGISYDVTAKGDATLRKKEENYFMNATGNVIDFTNAGSDKATAGDIDPTDRSSVSSFEVGDNEINAADYSTLVTNYNINDQRFDLDRSNKFEVSAADYSILVSNYNELGE